MRRARDRDSCSPASHCLEHATVAQAEPRSSIRASAARRQRGKVPRPEAGLGSRCAASKRGPANGRPRLSEATPCCPRTRTRAFPGTDAAFAVDSWHRFRAAEARSGHTGSPAAAAKPSRITFSRCCAVSRRLFVAQQPAGVHERAGGCPRRAPARPCAPLAGTGVRQMRWMAESRQVVPAVRSRLASDSRFDGVQVLVGTCCSVVVAGSVRSQADARDVRFLMDGIVFPHGVNFIVAIK